MTSCSDDLTDKNVDPKKPTITKAEYLFTNAQKNSRPNGKHKR